MPTPECKYHFDKIKCKYPSIFFFIIDCVLLIFFFFYWTLFQLFAKATKHEQEYHITNQLFLI